MTVSQTIVVDIDGFECGYASIVMRHASRICSSSCLEIDSPRSSRVADVWSGVARTPSPGLELKDHLPSTSRTLTPPVMFAVLWDEVGGS